MFNPGVETKEAFKRTGDSDYLIARQSLNQIAKAIELPLREGIMSGDIVLDIFEKMIVQEPTPDFPLDFLQPGSEDLFVAYAVPSYGALPQRLIESDYVKVPTYTVGNSLTWTQKYIKRARWDVLGRAMEVFEAGFAKKLNDDGFHVLLASAVDRNILVYDADASAGQFTKRLVSLLKVTMRRNGGGNSTSMNRRKLTDLYCSPEALEDMRNWGVDQVDELTRREIYVAQDGTVSRVFGINLHDFDEFGVGQAYQSYFANDLAGSMGGSDVEIVLGLDNSRRGSFVMPMYGEVEMIPQSTLLEQRMGGVAGTLEVGFGCLDGRYTLLGSF